MTARRKPSVQDMPRDARTGELRPAGYGSLKGRFMVKPDIDLTKPIHEQVRGGRGAPGSVSNTKHGAE